MNKIHIWDATDRLIDVIRKNKINFNGDMSNTVYTDLDSALFLMLGHKQKYDVPTVDDAMKANNLIRQGKVNVDWLFSEHAVALLKAKIIQTPELHKWFPDIAKGSE